MKMIFKNLTLVFISAIFLSSCGKKSSNSSDDRPIVDGDKDPAAGDTRDGPNRVLSNGTYKSVGTIYTPSGRCSGVILKHGIFATAKHCFQKTLPTGSNLTGMVIRFSNSGIIDTTNLRISGTDIKEVIFDSDNNDIAYVLYQSSTTEDQIALDAEKIETEQPLADVPVHIVGFPTLDSAPLKRLTSFACKVTGKTDYLPPKPKDPLGYDGLLIDTDCIAWFGNSGGPFFQVSEVETNAASSTPISVLGVVSHTFDIEDDGSLKSDLIKTDDFGDHVSSTNISPFSEAEQLEHVLSL